MTSSAIKFFQSALLLFSLLSFTSLAARPEFQLALKNHLFYPAEIKIPENTKVKLIIHNQDKTPEEFDSFDLNREKVIFPEKKAVIFIGPLSPGRYEFFGEFNPNSAQGAIIVVPSEKSANAANADGTNISAQLEHTAPRTGCDLCYKEVISAN